MCDENKATHGMHTSCGLSFPFTVGLGCIYSALLNVAFIVPVKHFAQGLIMVFRR